MPRKPVTVTTVLYTPVEAAPHRDYYRNGGPPLEPDWPARYLEHLAKSGKGWLAAKQAGVSYKTVQRLRAVDARFADDEADCVREFAESLEANLDRIATGDDMPAVTANIVRLKKLDPVGYVERNLTVTASFSTTLDPEEGKTLLGAILGSPALPQAEPLPSSQTSQLHADGDAERVLPASHGDAVTRELEAELGGDQA